MIKLHLMGRILQLLIYQKIIFNLAKAGLNHGYHALVEEHSSLPSEKFEFTTTSPPVTSLHPITQISEENSASSTSATLWKTKPKEESLQLHDKLPIHLFSNKTYQFFSQDHLQEFHRWIEAVPPNNRSVRRKLTQTNGLIPDFLELRATDEKQPHFDQTQFDYSKHHSSLPGLDADSLPPLTRWKNEITVLDEPERRPPPRAETKKEVIYLDEDEHDAPPSAETVKHRSLPFGRLAHSLTPLQSLKKEIIHLDDIEDDPPQNAGTVDFITVLQQSIYFIHYEYNPSSIEGHLICGVVHKLVNDRPEIFNFLHFVTPQSAKNFWLYLTARGKLSDFQHRSICRNFEDKSSFSLLALYRDLILNDFVTELSERRTRVFSLKNQKEMHDLMARFEAFASILPFYSFCIDLISAIIPTQALDPDGKMLKVDRHTAVQVFLRVVDRAIFGREQNEEKNINEVGNYLKHSDAEFKVVAKYFKAGVTDSIHESEKLLDTIFESKIDDVLKGVGNEYPHSMSFLWKVITLWIQSYRPELLPSRSVHHWNPKDEYLQQEFQNFLESLLSYLL